MALHLALVALTVYRLTRLVVLDSFPPAARFREAVAERFGDESPWTYLVHCAWCASVYVAAAVVGAMVAAGHLGWADVRLPLPALVIPVASGLTGLVVVLLDAPAAGDETDS